MGGGEVEGDDGCVKALKREERWRRGGGEVEGDDGCGTGLQVNDAVFPFPSSGPQVQCSHGSDACLQTEECLVCAHQKPQTRGQTTDSKFTHFHVMPLADHFWCKWLFTHFSIYVCVCVCVCAGCRSSPGYQQEEQWTWTQLSVH